MIDLPYLLRTFEGLKLTAYLCPAGVWTIGYGATGPDIIPGLTWTKEQCEVRMQADALLHLHAAKRLCPLAEGPHLVALADFSYNLGVTRLASSTLRRKYNSKNYIEAAKEIEKWVWGGGRKLPGLIARRKVEAALLLS